MACSVPTSGQLHTLQNAVLSLPYGMVLRMRLAVPFPADGDGVNRDDRGDSYRQLTALEELRRSVRVVTLTDDSDVVGGNAARP